MLSVFLDGSMSDTAFIQKYFEEAAERVKGCKNLSNANKLQVYVLFKQVKNGPLAQLADPPPRPSMFNKVAQMKWDAWSKLDSMSKEDAMKKYIKPVSYTHLTLPTILRV